MKEKFSIPTLEEAKTRFRLIVNEQGLDSKEVKVSVKTLKPEEAIGKPARRDYPIVEGKERVIEVEVMGAKAQAFTDSPKEFAGTIGDVLSLSLSSNGERAIFIGTLNAVLKHLGRIEATLHCKDEEPAKCAAELAAYMHCTYGQIKVGLIGLNPAIAESLVNSFGPESVRITDLNNDNIGKKKFNVEIWDGKTQTEALVKFSDLVIFTGTTLVNNTFDTIYRLINAYKRKYYVFGVTASGINELLGLQSVCPYGRKE